MKIAVTGGSGFIGSHVVDRLCAAGHSVVILDRVPPSFAGDATSFMPCDVTEPAQVASAMDGAQVVFHLAGMSNVDTAERDPLGTVRLNVDGTAAVLDAARRNGVERVVLASTVWVYGAAVSVEGELDEDVAIELASAGHLYTSTKLAAELLMHSYRKLYGQHFTILRYGIPYGPRMRDELVIAKFIQRALNGQPLTIAGDGLQTRRYIYVEDLAAAHVAALDGAATDEVFALEGPAPVSVVQLAESVTQLVGNVSVERVAGRSGDYTGRLVATDKAFRLLGWRPETSIADGLARCVQWYRSRAGAVGAGAVGAGAVGAGAVGAGAVSTAMGE